MRIVTVQFNGFKTSLGRESLQQCMDYRSQVTNPKFAFVRRLSCLTGCRLVACGDMLNFASTSLRASPPRSRSARQISAAFPPANPRNLLAPLARPPSKLSCCSAAPVSFTSHCCVSPDHFTKPASFPSAFPHFRTQLRNADVCKRY